MFLVFLLKDFMPWPDYTYIYPFANKPAIIAIFTFLFLKGIGIVLLMP